MMSFGGRSGARKYAARWYQDPNQPERLRYWDGSQWTTFVNVGGTSYDERVGAPGIPPVPPGTPLPVFPPGTVVSKSAPMMIRMILVIVVVGLLAIGGLFLLIVLNAN